MNPKVPAGPGGPGVPLLQQNEPSQPGAIQDFMVDVMEKLENISIHHPGGLGEMQGIGVLGGVMEREMGEVQGI